MVRLGIGSDARIGKRFLFPGIGYGGSCFPKDVKALIHSADSAGYDFKILKSVEQVNETQKKALIPKIISHYGEDLSGKTIAMWGLAFKPNTDDIREAPALELIEELRSRGAKVQAYDAEAMGNVKKVLGEHSNLNYSESPYEACESADFLIIATEWPEFRSPNFEKLFTLLRDKVIFDGRNVFDNALAEKHAFTYYSIGRASYQA